MCCGWKIYYDGRWCVPPYLYNREDGLRGSGGLGSGGGSMPGSRLNATRSIDLMWSTVLE